MSTRERLHEIVDELTEEQAAILEDYAEQLLDDDEVFTEEEIDRILKQREEMKAGAWVDWEDVKRELNL